MKDYELLQMIIHKQVNIQILVQYINKAEWKEKDIKNLPLAIAMISKDPLTDFELHNLLVYLHRLNIIKEFC